MTRLSRRGFVLGVAGVAAGAILNNAAPFEVSPARAAVATGSSDDLQRLLNAAGASAVVTGDWLLDSAVNLPKALRHLELDSTCRLIVRGQHSALSKRGSIAFREKPLSGFSSSTAQFRVADAARYRTNEFLLVSAANTIENSTARPGYLRKVKSLQAGAVVLDKATPRSLGNDPKVSSVTMSSSITITGSGEIFAETPTTNRIALVTLFAVSDPDISGIHVHDSGGSGILLEHCYRGRIACDITDLLDDEENDHFGYGVNVTGSTRGTTIEGTAARVRHAVTTNTGRYITNVGSVGEPEDCIFAPVAVDCTNKALDTHRPGWNILMIPHVTGGTGAVQVRADNTRVEGGTIVGSAGPAISVRSEVAVPARITDVTVRDLKFPGTALRSSGPSVTERMTVRGGLGNPNIELSDNCVVHAGSISGGGSVGVQFLGSFNSVTEIQLGVSVRTPYLESPGAHDNVFTTAPPTDIENLPAPTALTQVAISGVYKIRNQLTVTPAQWDLGGLTSTYSWYRDDVLIPNATDRTYRTYDIVAEDVGKKLRVVHKVSKAGYTPAQSESVATPFIEPGDPLVPMSLPEVTGSGAVGTYVKMNRGSWPSNPAPKTVTHEWVINGVPTGSTLTSIRVTRSDIGRGFQIKVTATRPGHLDAVVVSNIVNAVA